MKDDIKATATIIKEINRDGQDEQDKEELIHLIIGRIDSMKQCAR
jgi:hypothetical protein